MNKLIKNTCKGFLITAALSGAASASVAGEKSPATDLEKMDTLEMCVAYSTLNSESVKQGYYKELQRRGMLSHKDEERISKGEAGTSSTMCGMYMALGKPLAEQSRQLRPMIFKSVHVYPDWYFVSQAGMIVESYERKEGVMPPALIPQKPDVEPPPVLYKAPK